MKLTKQAVSKLHSSPIEVRLYNGCFNIASVKAKFSRYSWELRVERTHPFLTWQCGNKNRVELIYWKGYSGTQADIPHELFPLIEKMKETAMMSDEEARQKSKENAEAFQKAFVEFGICS